MTLNPKKNKNKEFNSFRSANIKQPFIPKPIKINTQPNTKLTKENYNLLQKLTGSGFTQIHKK